MSELSDYKRIVEAPRIEALEGTIKGLRTALFMCASHCQGGHSDAGHAAAAALGIAFPVSMDNLVRRAKSEGLDPDQLWPWLRKQRGG